MRIGACRAFASTLVTAALIGLTACSGSSSSSASSSSENASVAVASAPATQSADCASADFGDACHLDELDFGQVPKMDPSATDAAGCPTMTEWAAFAQPDVDVVNDPKAPTLSDACLTSVMAGLTQIYRAAASSQDP
jgi:hypothetical protein